MKIFNGLVRSIKTQTKSSTLGDLGIGQKAKITKFKDNSLFSSLGRMGLMPNDTVEIYAKTPFKGPVAIRKGNTIIALRRELLKLLDFKVV